MALELSPGEAGLGPTEALPRAYGVLMDIVYPRGAATLAALADGTTSLYLSSGRPSFVDPGAVSRPGLTVTSQSFRAGRVISSGTGVRLGLGHAPITCRLPLDAQVVEQTPDAVTARRRLSTSTGYSGWDDL